jgi:hypothetical protein
LLGLLNGAEAAQGGEALLLCVLLLPFREGKDVRSKSSDTQPIRGRFTNRERHQKGI